MSMIVGLGWERWLAVGWSLDKAKLWASAGWYEPEVALEWLKAGWEDPATALTWYNFGWKDPYAAMLWKRHGGEIHPWWYWPKK